MSSIFEEKKIPAEKPEDYIGEDGLKHCGVCGEAKEELNDNGEIIFGHDRHPRQCACKRKGFEEDDRLRKEHAHRAVVDSNRSICFTDPELRRSRFGNTEYVNHGVFEIAKNYADNRIAVKKENLGILFWGGVGTGKSRLAACIANAFLDEEERVLMSNMGRFLNLGIKEQEVFISEIHRYGLVIFDDLGTERQTPFSLEMIFRLIDARYVSKLPTIITTNLTLEELKNPPDLPRRRIYSRILEMCTPVYVLGPSIRETIADSKMKLMRQGLQ